MRGSLALLLPLLLASPGPLASEDLPPPTAADVLSIGNDIPGRLTVPVSIGKAGPYPFTIDTGAERTVLSFELARLLGLARGRNVRVTAMTGVTTVGTAVIPSLQVSRIVSGRIEAPLFRGVDLGAPGLLGLDSLKGRAVSIDFDTSRMSVTTSAARRREFGGSSGDIIVRAKSIFGQLVVTDAYFRGQRVRVVLDTGTTVSIGNLALLRQALRAEGGLTPVDLISVTGDRLNTQYTRIGAVSMGPITFRSLPVAFADAPPFDRFGLADKPALLLGLDALRQFRRVDIDFGRREIRLALPRDQL